ncbi:FAD-binding oxidoreductase [Streptomyces mirabilis]|uniref:FAD-binding oxidoreductase n=1 Tax=Streptomyces mirabilis TaxID=68239 RepID=UPI003673697C
MELTEQQQSVRDAVLAELDGSFNGELLTEDSTGYDQARTLWNAMVDKRPALVARCKNTDDVVAVVNAARLNGALLSVRGGGHGVVGKALADGGVTLDLSAMNGVTVDVERKHVHVQGGCRLGDVDAATSGHGLAVPAGIVSDTGVGGLALGGGVGWLSRKYGLTCDNVISFEVVTASGDVLEVSATEHPDLFWALRGGGGNFGVVTRLTFRAYDFGPDVRFGAALYTAETAADALRAYAEIYPSLPNEVGWHVTMKRSMPALPFVPPDLVGKPLVMLFCLWVGDVDDPEGVETIECLVRSGDPAVNTVAVIPFGLGLQRFLDAEFPDGLRNYTKEAHLTELSHGAIDVLLDFWKTVLSGAESSIGGELTIYGLGGVVRDVPEDATAFSNRDSVWWVNYACHWKAAEDDERNMAAIRVSCRALEPWLGPGIYVNMLNVDELDRVIEAYGGPEKYARLGAVKAKYDPGNLFCVNHNIAPTAT